MTGIEWTEEVWNPATGCDRVSAGCDHCYALTMAKRLKGMGQPKYQRDGDPRTSGPGFGLTVHPDALTLPLHWRKPRRVFVNSMSDLFHADVPDEFIARVFAVMALAPQHTFQVLTKRHGRMRSLLSGGPRYAWAVPRHPSPFVQAVYAEARKLVPKGPVLRWPLPNVWLGVSIEDQKWANIRIPALLATPAAVRFLSCEPLLGPVNLIGQGGDLVGAGIYSLPDPPEHDGGEPVCQDHGIERCTQGCRFVDWVIAGGESGPGARPCDLDWLCSLRDQCEAAWVPFFCKQLGSVLGRQLGAGPKGGDWSAWPEDLRIREFPVISKAAA